MRVAEHLTERWEPAWDAPTRRDRRGGTYHPYVPDPLVSRSITFTPRTAERIATAETLIRGLSNGSEGHGLEHLARFLLRSEAIASSRIEGLQVSPQQVALAELATTEEQVRTGFSATAKLVANNVIVLRRAVSELVAAPTITTADVVALHRALLPDERHHGLRSVQNWIGGGNWHPLDAEFVPPPPGRVPSLMDDLAIYATGAAHAPLAQAALVHAQFETLHPFTDGNGRVGRALIHTVLTRRGLTSATVLPISLVFFTRSDDYIRGLTAFRHTSRRDGPEADAALDTWLTIFIDATELAVEQAERFAAELEELKTEWSQRLAAHRSGQGLRAEPRAGSAVARLLQAMPETPVLTAHTVRRLLGVSHPAARAALEELAEARILSRKQVDRGATGYLARDLFELLTLTERRLASTRWDTRESAPNRAVPARPQHT
jgi:Fic family protein